MDRHLGEPCGHTDCNRPSTAWWYDPTLGDQPWVPICAGPHTTDRPGTDPATGDLADAMIHYLAEYADGQTFIDSGTTIARLARECRRWRTANIPTM
jgi:hypothetical protein